MVSTSYLFALGCIHLTQVIFVGGGIIPDMDLRWVYGYLASQ